MKHFETGEIEDIKLELISAMGEIKALEERAAALKNRVGGCLDKLMTMNATELVIKKGSERSIAEDIRKFGEIQKSNKFVSVWSLLQEVSPVEMLSGKQSPFSVKSLVYSEHWGERVSKKFTNSKSKQGKNLTWFELWQASEELIKESGDKHHVFIEGFDKVGDGEYRLVTGS